jgi:hypothetical protein
LLDLTERVQGGGGAARQLNLEAFKAFFHECFPKGDATVETSEAQLQAWHEEIAQSAAAMSGEDATNVVNLAEIQAWLQSQPMHQTALRELSHLLDDRFDKKMAAKLEIYNTELTAAEFMDFVKDADLDHPGRRPLERC